MVEYKKVLSKDQKRIKKLKTLMKKYGNLLDLPAGTLPSEHKAPLGGGLRCFSKVYQRSGSGKKLKNKKKIRCGNPARKRSFFCKKHGGANSYALVHGERSMSEITGGLYGRSMPKKLKGLMEQFLNDPKILDLRPELAALRLALSEYMKELTSDKPKQSAKSLLKIIKDIGKNPFLNPKEKFIMIRDLCATQSFLTDGQSLDRLHKIIETISRVAERMHKIQSQDNYLLTPEGLKILLRSIVELLKDKIVDSSILEEIRNGLMDISTQTKGNIHDVERVNKREPEDADFKYIEE